MRNYLRRYVYKYIQHIVYRERGDIYFMQMDYAHAIEDYSRALSLGDHSIMVDSNAHLLLNRGKSYIATGEKVKGEKDIIESCNIYNTKYNKACDLADKIQR